MVPSFSCFTVHPTIYSEGSPPYAGPSHSADETYIRYLKQFKVPEADEATKDIPGTNPTSGIFIIDTADLFASLEGRSGERRGLERMCRLLKMYEVYYMHNAGNDAHVGSRYSSIPTPSDTLMVSRSSAVVDSYGTKGYGIWRTFRHSTRKTVACSDGTLQNWGEDRYRGTSAMGD